MIRGCSLIFNFSNENSSNLTEKHIKRQMLKEIILFFDYKDQQKDEQKSQIFKIMLKMDQNQEMPIESKTMNLLFSMLKTKLFRNPKVQISSNSNRNSIGLESIDPKMNPNCEEILLEESWSHIQLNYEILVRIIIYPHFSLQLLKNYVDY